MSANFASSVRKVLEAQKLSVNAAAKSWCIPQKTLESVVKGTRVPTLDTAEKVAKKAKFELWQMLHADFDPANPPALMPVSPREREFHRRLRELMRDAPVIQDA